MTSLRSRITVGVALLVMVVVGLAGVIIAARVDHRDRAELDEQLTGRAEKVREDIPKLLDQVDPSSQDDYGELLAGSQSLVRLFDNGQLVAQRGELTSTPLPFPTADGFSTVEVDGQRWRSLVESLDGGRELQVLVGLEPTEERRDANTRLVVIVTLAATVVAGCAAWLVTRVILAPLERLRDGAHRLADAGERLPAATKPQEVADLSAALNGMLEQLQTSMQSTRRFTADAGHELRTPLTSLGINLETLQRNPDLPADQRATVLEAMAVEHQRITALLGGLQSLARGDAGALPARTTVDLAEVVTEAVRQAGRRHLDVTYDLQLTANPLIEGWEAGLRLAVDNLLDNAALHGRPAGAVSVLVEDRDRMAHISVTDDGPGIPAEIRDAMKERFTRGPDPRSGGSGLGLALAQQQAELHQGTLLLEDAPGGGLRATLALRGATYE